MREIVTSVKYKKELKKTIKSKTFDIDILNEVIEKYHAKHTDKDKLSFDYVPVINKKGRFYSPL